jgi:hypothetical protein
MTKAIVTFKPKQVVKELLAVLPVRAQDILKRRYGLGVYTEKETLEAIGEVYDITRERVRQIENFALSAIRRSPAFDKSEFVFNELKELMEEYGIIVRESDFLLFISSEESYQNHIHFLLVLGDYFERLREDEHFHHRWTSDKVIAEKVHKSLRSLYEGFTPDELVAEAQVLARFLKYLEKELKEVKDEKTARRWLALSKTIDSNPLGEWGVAASPNIKARGIRDLAYLVLRNHGSPMHFTEVASTIEKKFNRKAHEATVHNELIKDKRFVLVGRGLYALTEWGYERGVVRDIIKAILKREGPLSKKQIIDKVLKERHVKENTIVVNLQNSRYFKKDKNGNYAPVS